jgi:GWxTD domain-containing protein
MMLLVTLLDQWVQTPLAGALGWTLLDSLWEGAILAAVLAALLPALRSARSRYGAACAAMLLLLGACGVTLLCVMPDSAQAAHTLPPPAFPGWNVRLGLGLFGAANPSLSAIVPWLAPFWMAGVFIFGLRQAAGWIYTSRLRRRGLCLAPEKWQRSFARLRARAGVSRPVALLESCMAEVPLVLGHFRPVVLMPVGLLTGLPAEQIEGILLHELAHVGRCDYLVNLLQRGVEGLLFYHPAVWWMGRVIRAERENCCDDVAVGIGGNVHEYAAALAALEQSRWSGRATALAATGGSLMKRIRRLLYPARPQGAWTPLFAALIVMAVAAATMTAWQTPPAHPSGNGVSPYVKWLDEEVVYIIDNRERASFLALTTDEERTMFIQQFWERRTPAFKKEHYRRLAYANKHFALPGAEGWRTDRGHMYILYGPPDEIESHPEAAPAAYEMWNYHHVDGRHGDGYFTFIDRTGQGDYRLAPANAK